MRELANVSAKWQSRWFGEGVFEANVDRSRPKFFITVPYPYIEGPPHIGHGRTFTVGDIVARFMRMMGYNVLFPLAFHITGTPIQAVSDRLAKGDAEYEARLRREVGLYVKDASEAAKIVDGFKDPWNIVRFFKDRYVEDYKSMGYSMDLRRMFTTGDWDYSSFIIWQYAKLRSRGFLVRGEHQVLYSPDENQAVGEHDIRGGDEVRVDIVQFNLIKFKLEDGPFLVAATLRPETIFGATNVWINPDSSYVEALVNGERWIISKVASWKLQYQGKEVRIVREFKGSELVGKFAVSPIGVKLPILPASFVDEDTATGVVYSVPAHAPYDYVALMDLKQDKEALRRFNIEDLVSRIEPIPIIKLPGYGKYPAEDVVKRLGVKSQADVDKLNEATSIVYRDEFYNGVMAENTPYSGLKVSEARVKVIEDLKLKGLWDVMYETEPRKVYTRGGSRVIVALIKDQWFLHFGNPEWKRVTLEAFNRIKIIPESYRPLFKSTIDWLDMRPCARKRGLGTRMPWDPDWVIESLSDSTIYMAYYTISHVLKSSGLAERLGELARRVIESRAGDVDSLNKLVAFYDYVFLGLGNVSDVARSLGVGPEVVERARAEFTYWYPVDLRHSGIDLITNHLTFFIAHHAAIFPSEYWPRAISLNNYVIREGRRMSKSLGNTIYLREALAKYTPDVVRLYVAYASDLDNVLDWRDSEVDSVLGRLMDIWNTAKTIIDMGPPPPGFKPANLTIPSIWLLSIVNRAALDIPKLMENLKIRDYALAVFFTIHDAIKTYLDVIGNIPRDEARYVLWTTLNMWVRMMQPITPHIAEEVWHEMGNSTYVSLETWPRGDESVVSDDVENAFRVVERLIDDLKEVLRLRQGRRAYIYVGPSEELYEAFNEALRLINQGMQARDVIRALMANERFSKMGQRIVDLVNGIVNGTLPRHRLNRDMEVRVIEAFKPYIEKRVGVEVQVQEALKPSYDPANRARLSMPGRPAIYVE